LVGVVGVVGGVGVVGDDGDGVLLLPPHAAISSSAHTMERFMGPF
jgi:hypothetical protein